MTVVFVTVGSTHFDQLTDLVDTQPVLQALHEIGCRKLIVQYGKAERKIASGQRVLRDDLPENGRENTTLRYRQRHEVEVEAYDYKPSLQGDFEQADLVIGHAGAGTIMETLSMEGTKMIVVVNDTLMHNHQTELAFKMRDLNHLKACNCSTLLDTIKTIPTTTFTPYNPHLSSQRIMKYVENLVKHKQAAKILEQEEINAENRQEETEEIQPSTTANNTNNNRASTQTIPLMVVYVLLAVFAFLLARTAVSLQ
eukprot:m.64560 g.64560  ORF g.64560 m.64560 type:complete len:254 (+) comp11494_c0_seq1:47-808(+)